MHPGMSEGINQVFLFGNLGADPEVKQTSHGPILKLSLATNRSWLDKESQTKKEETEWHRITVFGKRGDALGRLLKKGERLFVRGRIHTSSYEKDGQKRYSTEIIAEDVQFGGNAGAHATAPTSMPLPMGSANGGYERRTQNAAFDEAPF
jgi:single-strand DNA-binding protein